MTEAEILHRLRPGAWVAKPERKALETMLARIQTAPLAASLSSVDHGARSAGGLRVAGDGGQSVLGHARNESGPRIEGRDAFRRACEAAMAVLRATPSWKWATYLSGVRESPKDDGSIAGYVSGGVFTVMRNGWTARTKEFASFFVHEGTHVARGHVISVEEERIAFANQVQALKEMGASGWLIRRYERHAANPTHNFSYTPQ